MQKDIFEKNLNKIQSSALEEIKKAGDLNALEKIRIKLLGRKGELTMLLKGLPALSKELRAHYGRHTNDLKNKISEAIFIREHELQHKDFEKRLKSESIDITAPGIRRGLGHLHPLTLMLRRIEDIFESMGFSVIKGPEIESEWYNFDALNIPADHPARALQDTFWLKMEKAPKISREKLLLRTHTSPMQVRFMEKNTPPLRIIVPGRVYRYEATDAAHDIQFNQVEGLMVDKNISLANLKAVLEDFFKTLFIKGVKVRFRPGYFPFVEPGIEIDISCFKCGQHGCRICSGGGWLEVAGAGMVHPKVFENSGLVPGQWQGFAFGIGLDRLAMIYYGIDDIRLLYSGDLRFLKQF